MPYIVSCGFSSCFCKKKKNLRRLASKLLNHISTIDLVIFQNLNHSWAPWISSCEATHGLNALATTEHSFGSVIFTVQMLDGSVTAYSKGAMLEGSNGMTQNCCLLNLNTMVCAVLDD